MNQARQILLLEAAPHSSSSLSAMLTSALGADWAVTSCEHLADAFIALAKGMVDLFLLDLDHPGCKGLNTVQRALEQAPEVVLILCAARDDDQLRQASFGLGVQDYLLKEELTAALLSRLCRHAVERHGTLRQLRARESLSHASLDALTAHIAVLDQAGTIVQVNEAWRAFAAEHRGGTDRGREGDNYLDAVRETAARGDLAARGMVQGIGRIFQGSLELFEIEYSCHGPEGERWFHLRACPLPGEGPLLLVMAHEDITARKMAEEALQRSEARARQIFESLPIGLWMADSAGRITRGNPEARRIWGAEPLVGVEQYGLFKARFLSSGREVLPHEWALRTTIEQGVQVRDELLEIHAFDGEVRTIRNYTTPLFGAGGEVVGALVANIDVSRQQEIKNALVESEQRLRTIFEAAPNGIFIKNQQGEYLMANQALAASLDMDQEELIGKTDQDLVRAGRMEGEDAARYEQARRQVLATGVPLRVAEDSFCGADGALSWFNSSKIRISVGGDDQCLLGIFIDITEQREAREKLRNSELRLRAILNALSARVVLIDPRMRIIWANETALKAMELSLEEAMGQDCHQILHGQGEVCEDCGLVTALESGQASSTIRHSSRGKSWLASAAPVYDDQGTIVSAVSVLEDISEKVMLEKQLRQAQKMESLGTLAGGIAHDFNNILAGVLGYTELAMLKMADREGELFDYLREIHGAGVRATGLVRQILTFSRRAELELIPLDIGLVVKEGLKLLRSTLPSTVELVQGIAADTSQVLADPTQIHQIIMNLCTNANHAMEPWGGILEVRLEQCTPLDSVFESRPELTGKEFLCLLVSDGGCGIAPEALESIFDPYYTTKEPGVGTGLGLSVVHGIVHDLGGMIQVESEPGKGSRFRVYLPVEKAEARRLQEVPLEKVTAGVEHILVVDDEPVLLRVLDRILAQYGYTVTTESDPLQALALIQQQPDGFDLLLSDVTMPMLTGNQLAQEVLQLNPRLPICLMTGFSNIISEESVKEIGCKALLEKPVSRKDLLTTVRRLLDAEERAGISSAGLD
ncbi:PAS domain-containing protein [Desulfogranum mediterraneum]|uniref:PAS domain-containing protein n=1 Tax=Desulfogranum mediterraneum TaxID=160661 RepID=UPI000685C98C|nr:PAS domain-containing protein [Desulfogranum mediterraneum]